LPFIRPQADILTRRLREPRRFIQVVDGLDLPSRIASSDEPTLRSAAWLEQQWEAARLTAADASRRGAVLVLDEVQKLTGWSETVKRLWDEDTRTKRTLQILLLGSAPLLITRGLGPSLAGRFAVIHLAHWSFAEMRAAFGWSLDTSTSCMAAIRVPNRL